MTEGGYCARGDIINDGTRNRQGVGQRRCEVLLTVCAGFGYCGVRIAGCSYCGNRICVTLKSVSVRDFC